MPDRSRSSIAPSRTTGVEEGQDDSRLLVVATPERLDGLRQELASCGFPAEFVGAPEAAGRAATWRPAVVLIDADLPDLEALIDGVRPHTDAVCALTTSAVTGALLTSAARVGADALAPRPLEEPVLRRLAGWNRGAQRSGGGGQRPEAVLPPVMFGAGQEMRDMWRLVMLAAAGQASVVVLGETGVGKEVVARALHRFSARRAGPFVAVNAAALPATLLESELFGYEKGSFTGAATQHRGRFELAHGGTIFLDEIGELSAGAQTKLLRVLQERCFERVGGDRSIPVDVRVVAATNRDLGEEMKRGRFRSDLYYRLSVISIRVPPLRERREDLLPMWDSALAENAAVERSSPPLTSPAAQRILLRHDWPGNVRELQNVAQHALTVVTGGTVLPADLPEPLSAAPVRGRDASKGLTLKEMERAAILDAYAAAGTVKAAASLLGISERKMQYRLRAYRRDDGESNRDRRPADPTAPLERGRPRVLLAEDDDELRWSLTDVLRQAGYDVVAVATGSALLEKVGAATILGQTLSLPDVILADIRMPGLTGMQLLERLRKGGWSTPVVLMSAFGDPETRRRAVALGAKAFLEKPIDFKNLQQVIEGAVAN